MYLYSVSTPHKSARSISRRFSLIIAPALLLCARDETIDWVEDGKALKMEDVKRFAQVAVVVPRRLPARVAALASLKLGLETRAEN